MDTGFLSATSLIRALRSKRIGALELLELYIERIGRYDSVLNALPARDFTTAPDYP
jgi:amidase